MVSRVLRSEVVMEGPTCEVMELMRSVVVDAEAFDMYVTVASPVVPLQVASQQQA